MSTINIPEERNKLLELPEKLENEPVIITEQGQPVMVAISYAQYVSMLETIDILSDREFKEQLIAGIAEDRQGKRVSWSDAIIQLGWE